MEPQLGNKGTSIVISTREQRLQIVYCREIPHFERRWLQKFKRQVGTSLQVPAQSQMETEKTSHVTPAPQLTIRALDGGLGGPTNSFFLKNQIYFNTPLAHNLTHCELNTRRSIWIFNIKIQYYHTVSDEA